MRKVPCEEGVMSTNCNSCTCTCACKCKCKCKCEGKCTCKCKRCYVHKLPLTPLATHPRSPFRPSPKTRAASRTTTDVNVHINVNVHVNVKGVMRPSPKTRAASRPRMSSQSPEAPPLGGYHLGIYDHVTWVYMVT